MKYILYLSLLLIFGCTQGINADDVEHTDGNNYNIKTIDSCEYIEYDYGVLDQRVYSITHKGNCKYCVERNKNQNK